MQKEESLLKKLQLETLALSRALSIEEVLRVASQSIRNILICDFTWILLADETGKYLNTYLVEGLDSPSQDQHGELSENGGILSAVFETGDPLFLDDLTDKSKMSEIDPMLAVLIDRSGIASLNLIPLGLPGGNIGIIGFGRKDKKPISVEEKRLALIYVYQVAVSVERARLYRKEQEDLAELSRLNELKSRLLYGLSHELKTPLTSLRTSTDLLKGFDGMDTRTRKRLVENIMRATERLVNVADEIYPVADALTNVANEYAEI